MARRRHVVTLLALLVGAGPASLARGASEEDCRRFHAECVEARARGADGGICNVERLECRIDETGASRAAGERPRPRTDASLDRGRDPETTVGP